MGTPDALRLSRLDRLISQLGEHQLSIRQQGTSVTDLDERVRVLETKVAEDMQALWPLREVDVHGELTAARASIDKLGKQVALLGRDQEEGRIQVEKRLQQVEARQTEVERQLAALVAVADATASESAAAVEELRQATKGMLSEVISRIADQFDALQAALEEAISGRAAQANEGAAAAAAVQQSLEAQREWLQERADGVQQQLDARLEASNLAAAAAAEQHHQRVQEQLGALEAAAEWDVAGLRAGLEAAQHQLTESQQRQEAHAEQLEQHATQLAAMADVQEKAAASAKHSIRKAEQQAAVASAALQHQMASLAEEQKAAAARQADAEGLLRQALTVWQRGVEEQFVGLEAQLGQKLAAAAAAHEQVARRFEEYKGYVKRLRREIADARAEQESNSTHIAAVRQTFDSSTFKMERVHAEAAALGDELLEATTVAAAMGKALCNAVPQVQ